MMPFGKSFSYLVLTTVICITTLFVTGSCTHIDIGEMKERDIATVH